MPEEKLTKVSAWTMVAIFAGLGLIVSIVMLVYLTNDQLSPIR